jgi:hypothetical protein
MVIGSWVAIDAMKWRKGAIQIQHTAYGLLKHSSIDMIAIYQVVKIIPEESICRLNSGLWSPIDCLIEVKVHE